MSMRVPLCSLFCTPFFRDDKNVQKNKTKRELIKQIRSSLFVGWWGVLVFARFLRRIFQADSGAWVDLYRQNAGPGCPVPEPGTEGLDVIERQGKKR